VLATSGGSSTPAPGSIFIAKTPELFDDPATTTQNEGYDLDGNMLRDGRWDYLWDAENRLVRMTTRTAFGPARRIDFEYDHQGRLIRKKRWNNTAGTNPVAEDRKYLYDGWNLVGEFDGNTAIQRTYVWGTDLSGTLQGAGGVGGLLLVRHHPTTASYHFA
jgi:hypothetical protein